MFKTIYNNKLHFLILTLIVTFLSCDGRDRIYKTNAEVLTENNLLNSYSEQIKFVPEQKIEIVTDTILSNGFQIKMHYKSIENNTVLSVEKNKNDRVTKTHHKNFEAKLQVLKNGITINQSIINKKLFIAYQDKQFWDNAIMQYVWIDYKASNTNALILNTSFNIPNTETYIDFVLKIDRFGTIQINEINRSAYTI